MLNDPMYTDVLIRLEDEGNNGTCPNVKKNIAISPLITLDDERGVSPFS